MSDAFFVKVEGPDFQLPQVVLDHLVLPSNDAALVEHVASETPHPAYDDLPSFTLLFENGLA